MNNDALSSTGNEWDETKVPSDTLDFARYIAGIASRITAGDADPAAVNWRYVRDRALSAIFAAENGR